MITNLQEVSNLKEFNDFNSRLSPKIGEWGGRYFIIAGNDQQYCLNEIITRFREIHPTAKKEQLTSIILTRIEANDQVANTLLSKSSLLVRILTVIRQFFGNYFYKGESKEINLAFINDLPDAVTVTDRNEKNINFAKEQGENEEAKGFDIPDDIEQVDTLSCLVRGPQGSAVRSRQIESESILVGRQVGRASCEGTRDGMEDKDITCSFDCNVGGVTHQAELYGVFDGHAGANAAEFVQEHLRPYLKTALEKNEKLDDGAVWDALKEAFRKLDEDYQGDAGTTAAVALVLDGKFFIANVGDSRIVFSGDNRFQQLTEDAKPNIKRYKEKIEKNGGIVDQMRDHWGEKIGPHRVNGSLAVGRAIGDKSFGKVVSALPKISFHSLNALDGYLVIACDGLFDVASSKEVADEIQAMKKQGKSEKEMAHLLVQRAIESGSKDNVSALVVKL